MSPGPEHGEVDDIDVKEKLDVCLSPYSCSFMPMSPWFGVGLLFVQFAELFWMHTSRLAHTCRVVPAGRQKP